MKNMIVGIVIAALCAGALCAGCTSSVRRESMTPWAGKVFEETGKEIDEDVEDIIAKRRHLELPAKLAVIRVGGYYGGGFVPGEQKIWDTMLDKSDLIDDVVLLPEIGYQQNEGNSSLIRRARQTAARAGADVVLLYGLQTRNDTYLTPVICMLDLTIVGMFVTPGRTVDSLSLASGMVIDVGNGVIHTTVEGEARKTSAVPAQYAASDMYDEETRSKAVADMAAKVEEKLDRARGRRGKS